MRSAVRLSLECFKQLVDFHELQQGGHVTQGDLNAINFNPVFSTILKWRSSDF
jgi:hypothetical protein